MKRISGIILFLVATSAFSHSADWMNEAYGTYEGVSDNYENPYEVFLYTDELANAETNGYFSEYDEELSAWNNSNGYWK